MHTPYLADNKNTVWLLNCWMHSNIYYINITNYHNNITNFFSYESKFSHLVGERDRHKGFTSAEQSDLVKGCIQSQVLLQVCWHWLIPLEPVGQVVENVGRDL